MSLKGSDGGGGMGNISIGGGRGGCSALSFSLFLKEKTYVALLNSNNVHYKVLRKLCMFEISNLKKYFHNKVF